MILKALGLNVKNNENNYDLPMPSVSYRHIKVLFIWFLSLKRKKVRKIFWNFKTKSFRVENTHGRGKADIQITGIQALAQHSIPYDRS